MERNKLPDLSSLIPSLRHTAGDNFLLIAGPCVVEGREMALDIARVISGISDRYKIPYVFKASYRKANRSRLDSFRGIGDEKALKILAEVRETFGIPVITDVHSPEEAGMAAQFVDVLQIPAFLCRQTDLLVACAKTGKTVSVKKGQFLAPDAMKFAVDKVTGSGNRKVMITERGTTFGYQDLVVDFRGIPVMQQLGVPVILDVTHSLQQPNQQSGITGGTPALIGHMARTGIAAGADGIFIETHPDPPSALSDGSNMLPLSQLDGLMLQLVQLRETFIHIRSGNRKTS
ncbi:MAG: 3-deoxy-8-phosphooctulonate synthase [Bacteroidota bacterium]